MSPQLRTTAHAARTTHEVSQQAKRPVFQLSNEQVEQFQMDGLRASLRAKTGKMIPQDVLHLQRTVGNQAVMRMLAQRNAVQREDDDENQSPGQEQQQQQEGGAPQLTLEDEQKILRAKRVVQRTWT